MIIDPIDLRILRSLEAQGYVPMIEIINKFHITRDEICLRIQNFEEQGLLASYRIKLFIPAVAGGKWYRGCAFVDADLEPDIKNIYPLIEEVVVNTTIPPGVMPSYVYLFYTRDLKHSYRLMNKTFGVKYLELYKIAEYNFSVPRELAKEEWRLIFELIRTRLDFTRIYEILESPKSDDDIRLARLMLSRKNPRGIFSIFPNINWNIAKNFAHIHLAVTTKMRPTELKKFLKNNGIAADIYSKFKKKYIQLEFDLWGFHDMLRVFNQLRKERRIIIQGVSVAHHNEICDDWIRNLVKEKAH